MRALLPLLWIPLLSAGPQVSPTAETPRAQVHWAPCGIFDEHLQGCWCLRWTRHCLCAISGRESYLLEWGEDVSSACGIRLPIEEPDAVLVDAITWDKHFAEIRVARFGTILVDAELGRGFRPQPLPQDLQTAARTVRASDPHGTPCIAGWGETIVFYASGSIYRLENQVWTRVPLDLGGRELAGSPSHALLEGRKLYLGVEGLANGQLIAADIDSGRGVIASDDFPAGPNNVTDLEIGPDGRLYVTCAERFMATGGRLLVREFGSWKVLVSSPTTHMTFAVCVFDRSAPEPIDLKPADPNATPSTDLEAIPSSDFQALAFDDQGRPCILCNGLGIVRQELDGKWKCITPGWAETGADATDLAVVGHTAVLSSRNAGVVMLDLETLEGRRVRPH